MFVRAQSGLDYLASWQTSYCCRCCRCGRGLEPLKLAARPAVSGCRPLAIYQIVSKPIIGVGSAAVVCAADGHLWA